MKILMVCLGNICRSPLAEGILTEKVKKEKLNVKVDSAGTGGWHVGEAPDPRSVEIARQKGLDITHQRARKFSEYDFEVFDKIYVMDNQNKHDVLNLATTPEEENKVKLILDEIEAGQNKNVPDPYWDDDGFEKVFNMLDKATDVIIEKIKNNQL